MQAKHGFAGLFRVRGRLIVCALAVAALSAVLFAPAASAVNAPETDYLALGDSLAFGYTAEKFNNNFPTESPAAFEEGYAHFFAKKLRASSKKYGTMLQGLVEVNNGCPGETTDSMIGNGALAAAFGIPGESPCGYHKAGFPLHHEYGGVSQLENTLGVIAATGGKLKAVTLNIGSNDELKSVAKCEKEVKEEYEKEGKSKYGPSPGQAVNGCIAAHAKETFEHIIKNMGRVFFAIRHGSAFGAADYTGRIVVLGFYNPYSFVLPGSDALQKALNQAIEGTFFSPTRENPETKETEPNPNFQPNTAYANPFPKINVRKAPNEKANIAKDTEMCNPNVQKPSSGTDPGCEGDIHPTKFGYELLAKLAFAGLGPTL
jgi:lysophospholipase L1-like esterase